MERQVFRTLIQDLQNRKEYTLALQLQHDLIANDFIDRQEREKLKKEIVNEIMSNIDVLLETKAIDKLNKTINNLGK